jgi:pyroglutamyl-peptidase
MRTAIVTGFMPFLDYCGNPTQDLAQEFEGRMVGDVRVRGLVLPCAYYRAFYSLLDHIKRDSPDIVIGTGLATRIQKLRVETTGTNEMNEDYYDCDGKKCFGETAQPIIPGANHAYRTNTDARRVADAMASIGVDAAVSDDAGRFICNSLLYLTAGAIQEQRLQVKFAYINTPWTHDYRRRVNLRPNKRTIPKEDLHAAVEKAIAAMGRA